MALRSLLTTSLLVPLVACRGDREPPNCVPTTASVAPSHGRADSKSRSTQWGKDPARRLLTWKTGPAYGSPSIGPATLAPPATAGATPPAVAASAARSADGGTTTIDAHGAGAEQPTDQTDTDNDGLLDWEELVLGTDPNNPDTDGDGLLDGWEVHGAAGEDLRARGADPRHKDIFVEMDYMARSSADNGLGPSAAVLEALRLAFDRIPISNPDGAPGIHLHLEMDEQIDYVDDLNPHEAALAEISGKHFREARAPIYHYMVWANAYDGGDSSGVSMGIPSSEFIVTLGRWNGNAGGTDSEKIGTFMHELGHNLGLQHGGSDAVNNKPNYFSVMNYLWQTSGLCYSDEVDDAGAYRCGHYQYQEVEVSSLDERKLDERLGVSIAQGPGFRPTLLTQFFCKTKWISAPVAASVDWNCNGKIDDGTVSSDINGDRKTAPPLGTQFNVEHLNFRGGGIGSRLPPRAVVKQMEAAHAPMPPELTEKQNRDMHKR